jgi:hypothetical protein
MICAGIIPVIDDPACIGELIFDPFLWISHLTRTNCRRIFKSDAHWCHPSCIISICDEFPDQWRWQKRVIHSRCLAWRIKSASRWQWDPHCQRIKWWFIWEFEENSIQPYGPSSDSAFQDLIVTLREKDGGWFGIFDFDGGAIRVVAPRQLKLSRATSSKVEYLRSSPPLERIHTRAVKSGGSSARSNWRLITVEHASAFVRPFGRSRSTTPYCFHFLFFTSPALFLFGFRVIRLTIIPILRSVPVIFIFMCMLSRFQKYGSADP